MEYNINKLARLRSLRNSTEDGFTLIELLVVIIIIGILSAIALPLFFNQQAEAVKAGMKSDVRSTVGEVTTYLVSNPTAGTLDSSKTGKTGVATGVLKPVVTDEKTTVRVRGSWTGFTVDATNPEVAAFGYAHYSSDTAPDAQAGQGGKFVEVQIAPAAPVPGPGGDTTGPDADPDLDGLNNSGEDTYGTDKNNPDTDGDSFLDGNEVLNGSDPRDPNSVPNSGSDDPLGDNDNDGLSNEQEDFDGTDKNNEDTDGDGWNDYEEVMIWQSNPLSAGVTPVDMGADPR